MATNFRGQAAPAAATAAAPAPNRDIVIPLPEVSSGKAKFFDYAASGRKTVRFFAIKSSDGAYRVALDACDVCYHAKKGYEQSGDDMVCRNCRRRFPSTLIGEANGGCNPIAVARTIAGDKIIIKAADLDGMTAYF